MNTPELLSPDAVAVELNGAPAGGVPAAPVSDQAAPTPAAVTPNAFPGVVDKKGRPFDPLRHKVKNGAPFLNADGYFMPIGGRKPRGSDSATNAAPSLSPVSAPAAATPPPPLALPASSASAWSEADRAAAAATPPADANAPGSAPAAEVAPLADYSADAGKAISAGVFLLAGVVFDARDETTPQKAEAAHLTDATAAWIRSTGWRGGPLAGALLAWLAYFLGLAEKPKVGAKLRDWFGSAPKTQKQVTDIVATPVPPAAPKAAPVNPAAPVGFGGLRQG